ncbi:glycosyltransferase family 4 protein [Blastococcus sp. SYSU D00820]
MLILAPWFRNLARIHANELERAGYRVQIITTSAQRPSAFDARSDELVLEPRLRSSRVAAGVFAAHRVVRSFEPDVILADDTWDPRFAFIKCGATPRVVVVHDVDPHDDAHRLGVWKRVTMERHRRRASMLAAFSNFTESALRRYCLPVVRLALASEVSALSPERPSAGRQGFLFFGRASYYKGVDFLLDAWRQARPHLPPGETLTFLVSGSQADGSLAQWDDSSDVRVIRGSYTDDDLALHLGSVRAVVLPYREASQSGVQVVAHQFGVPAIVTRVGALPEYQADEEPVVPFGSVDELADAMVDLLDDCKQRELARRVLEEYEENHSREAVARRLVEALKIASNA